LEPLKVF